MNIFTYLKKDHRKVSDLLKRLISSPESDENDSILQDVINELTIHSESEQVTFYKEINKLIKGKEILIGAKIAHKKIKKAISIISNLTIYTPNWYMLWEN